MDQFILLALCRYDLIQRPIFVEEKVRVAISKHPRTFCCQHEELLAPIGNVKCSHLILAPIQWMPHRVDLCFSILVLFSRDVLVALRR